MIGTDGTISTVPGIPTGFAGGVTAAPDGTIFYLAGDTNLAGGTIFRIATDGTVTTSYANPDKWISTVAAISSTEIVIAESTSATSGDRPIERLDLTTSTATATGVTLDSGIGDSIPVAAAADGTIYLGTDLYHSGLQRKVLRIDPDNTVTPIAGTGTADPATARQYGLGTDLDLSPTGLAVTPNHGLLISSGHVVYRLDQPASAGATTTTTTAPPVTTVLPTTTSTSPSTTVAGPTTTMVAPTSTTSVP